MARDSTTERSFRIATRDPMGARAIYNFDFVFPFSTNERTSSKTFKIGKKIY